MGCLVSRRGGVPQPKIFCGQSQNPLLSHVPVEQLLVGAHIFYSMGQVPQVVHHRAVVACCNEECQTDPALHRHVLLVHRECVRQPVEHLCEVHCEGHSLVQGIPRNELRFLEGVVEDVWRSFRKEGQVSSFLHLHLQNHRWSSCIRRESASASLDRPRLPIISEAVDHVVPHLGCRPILPLRCLFSQHRLLQLLPFQRASVVG